MITINQGLIGEDKEFTVSLTEDNLPVDLTNLVQAKFQFLKSDGTFLTVDMSAGVQIVGSPLRGVLGVTLTRAQVNTLKFGQGLSFQGYIELGTHPEGDPANSVTELLFTGQLTVNPNNLVN